MIDSLGNAPTNSTTARSSFFVHSVPRRDKRCGTDFGDMRNVGKVTVQLLDGTGYGPRLVEIGNWVGKGYFAPRRALGKLLEREDCGKPGVYFLKYIDPENGREFVYIGEADCLSDRLKTHLRDSKKNHFLEAMFFVSHNDWLTKTQVKYLEHRLVMEANVKGAPILNRNEPSQPRIQEAEKPDLEDFLERIVLLLPIMGFRFMLEEFIPLVEEFEVEGLDEDLEDNEIDFEPIIPKTVPKTAKTTREKSQTSQNAAEKIAAPKGQTEVNINSGELQPKSPETPAAIPPSNIPLPTIGHYRIVDKYVQATMDIIDGYYVVRAGSQAKKDTSNSIDKIYLALRTALLDEQILVDGGQFYIFSSDYRFTSPSAASNVVLGRQSPGPRMWADQDNRSLRGIVNDSISR